MMKNLQNKLKMDFNTSPAPMMLKPQPIKKIQGSPMLQEKLRLKEQ